MLDGAYGRRAFRGVRTGQGQARVWGWGGEVLVRSWRRHGLGVGHSEGEGGGRGLGAGVSSDLGESETLMSVTQWYASSSLRVFGGKGGCPPLPGVRMDVLWGPPGRTARTRGGSQ